jgi:DNA polymerase-3 subunit gamma/tau
MAQSVATQPVEASPVADPLDGPITAGGPPDGQADDLLSELAGAEIDRMLAAADVEPAQAVVPPPLAPPLALVAEVAPPAPEPVLVAAPAPVAPPPAEPPAVPVAAPSDLDAVLAEASFEPPPPTPPQALPDAASVPLDLGDPIPGPWLAVRLLALINPPADAYPDHVRETVGKVAVVTLINAVAVLAYVMLFRRHG